MVRAMGRLLAVLILVGGTLGVSPVIAQDDAVSRYLGATPDNAPIWAQGSQQARQQLANFTQTGQKGVMLVGHPKYGTGTAWIISKKHRLLVTNAHVADFIAEAGGKMLAIANGTSQAYEVDTAWYHPGVRRHLEGEAALVVRSGDPNDGPVFSRSPDLAVIRLTSEGPDLEAEFQMATPEELGKLYSQPTAIIGFPGHDTRDWPGIGEKVGATYHDGVISRMTDFHGSPNVEDPLKQFVQYTMATWPGFSGSPIFLTNGHVVAIHNMAEPEKGRFGQVITIPHGVRIDCLWELIAYHSLEEMIPLPVDKSQVNYDRWLQDDPRDVELRRAVTLAEEASELIYDKEQFTAGVKKCNEAIKAAPNYARPYYLRCHGFVNYWFNNRRRIGYQEAFKQLEYAEKDALKYRELATSDPAGYVLIALVLNNYGTLTDNDSYNQAALNILNEFLSSDNIPDRLRAEAYSNRGIAYDNIDEDNQALRDHNEAIRLAPESPTFWENRADFWHYQGRGDLEAADYAKAKKLRSGQ